MLRKYRKIVGLAAASLGLTPALMAFSVWGPAEAWQTAELDYLTRNFIYGEVENGGTKELGAGSRMNVPVVTYGFDYSFLEYFGAQGVKAIDAAMAVMNGLPTASGANLNSFVTTEAQQINFTAQALSLYDLKSATLSLLLEHEGLLGETHIYDLRTRQPQPTPVPCQFYYYVVLRNYDPVTYNPTPFVNGVYYGYNIVDFCQAGQTLADAVEYPEDRARVGTSFTAVATKEGQLLGGYYTGLTRDDMGGLRYLYRQSRLVPEAFDPNSTLTSVGSSAWNPVGTIGFVGTNLTSALLGGVEKIRYVKVQYDSLEGNTFTPLVYTYSVPGLVNGHLTTLRFQRFITAPDLIFSAADLVDTGRTPALDPADNRSVTFLPSVATSAGGGVNGPGVTPSVITPQFVVTFNNANPLNFNEQPPFLSDQNVFESPLFQWGYFDGSGNPPIVFPNGTTLLEAEQEALAPPVQNVPTTWGPTLGTITGAVTFLGDF